MQARLLNVPASDLRRGDLLAPSLGESLRKIATVAPSHWPGDPDWPTVLVTFTGDAHGWGQHFHVHARVFVVRQTAPEKTAPQRSEAEPPQGGAR